MGRPVIADRVMETSATAGPGAFALAGAAAGFRAFAAAVGVGNQVYYVAEAVDDAGAPTGQFEWGLGTLTGATTLARTEVWGGSNGTSPVSFAGGTKRVFASVPGRRFERAFLFSWGDATPKTLLTAPAGVTVERVTLLLQTALDGSGAALAVGDAGDPNRLMAAAENDPAAAGVYETRPAHAYGAATPVLLTITPGLGAAAGAGIVIVDLTF